jgi:hypothetical protein
LTDPQQGKCCQHLATAIIKLKEQHQLSQERSEAELDTIRKVFQDKMAYLKEHELQSKHEVQLARQEARFALKNVGTPKQQKDD